MKKWNMWTKRQKLLVVSTVGILVVGGGTQVYASNHHKQLVKEAQIALKKESQSLDYLSNIVEVSRDSKNPNFLAKEVTMESINQIQKQLDQIKKEHESYGYKEVLNENKIVTTRLDILESETQTIAWQLETQEAVSHLFVSEKPIVAGTEVIKDLPIVNELKINEIEKVIKATKNKEMLTVIPVTTDEKNNWELTLINLTDQAKEQVKQIEITTQLVDSFYNKEKKPIDTTDTKKIKEAENQIKGIKNEKAKKELQEKVKAVSKIVEEKQKNEAEKKAKETGGTVKQEEDGSFEGVKAETGNYNESVTDSNNNNSASNYDSSHQGSTNNGGGNNGYNQGYTNSGIDNNQEQTITNNGNSNNSNGGGSSNTAGYDNSNNHTWTGEDPHTGGSTVGGIVGDPHDIPGIEFHYPE